MIPQSDAKPLELPLTNTEPSSLTWKLDFEKGRISGQADELEAVKQAVFKALQTNRFWHEIYSFDYGHELLLLIGTSSTFIGSEANRLIAEALMIDDRIENIDDVNFEVTGDQVVIRFRVNTIYGSFSGEVISDV